MREESVDKKRGTIQENTHNSTNVFPVYSHRHGNPKVTGILAKGGRLRERAGNPKMARSSKGSVQDQGVRNDKKQVRGRVYIDATNERRRGGNSGMGAPKDGRKASGEAS